MVLKKIIILSTGGNCIDILDANYRNVGINSLITGNLTMATRTFL
jgi:hypothetical protein